MKVLLLLLQLLIYSLTSKKLFLKRFKEEATISLKRKISVSTPATSKKSLVDLPVCESYFTIATVNVYDAVNHREKGTFTILSLHQVSTYDTTHISTIILGLHNRIVIDFFYSNYRYILQKPLEKGRKKICLLNVNKGFVKEKVSGKFTLNSYKYRYFSFQTDKFVQCLKENKEIFQTPIYSSEQRIWETFHSVAFMSDLEGEEYFFRLKLFTVNHEDVFLINQSITMLGTCNKRFSSTLTSKACVRIDEEKFVELKIFIETFNDS